MALETEDIDVIERVLAGEVEAFSIVVERYGSRLFTVIYRITYDRELSEELTQDVFVKVFNSLAKFRRGSLFSTWLYRIAYNAAISELRKRKHVSYEIDENRIAATSEDFMDEEFRRASQERRYDKLERALMWISHEERTLVWLFYNEEKPVAEIAGIMGVSVAAVKVKLHRTRKKIAILMNDDDEKE